MQRHRPPGVARRASPPTRPHRSSALPRRCRRSGRRDSARRRAPQRASPRPRCPPVRVASCRSPRPFASPTPGRRPSTTIRPPEPNRIRVKLAGANGVSPTASAAVLTVTAVNGGIPNFVTVFPTSGSIPVASNLNLVSPGEINANLVTVKIGTGGSVDVYSPGRRRHDRRRARILRARVGRASARVASSGSRTQSVRSTHVRTSPARGPTPSSTSRSTCRPTPRPS